MKPSNASQTKYPPSGKVQNHNSQCIFNGIISDVCTPVKNNKYEHPKRKKSPDTVIQDSFEDLNRDFVEISEYKLPSPSNIYDDLTGHMIRCGLMDQAIQTLMDKTFIFSRIEHLGMIRCTKVLIKECKLIQRKIYKKKKKINQISSMSRYDEVRSSKVEEWKCLDEIITKKDVDSSCSSSTSSSSRSESTHSQDSLNILEEKSVTIALMKEMKTCLLHILRRVQNESYIDDDDPTLRNVEASLHMLGNHLLENSWHHEAMKIYRCCLSLRLDGDYELTTQEEYFNIGQVLSKIGEIESERGKFMKSLHAYSASVEKIRIAGNKIEEAKLYNRIGDVYGAQGGLQSALVSYSKALKIEREEFGDLHLSLAETLHNIGVVHRHMENLDAALQSYKEALDILKRKNDGNLDVARTLNNIGSIYRRKGEYDKAMEYFVKVLKIRRKVLGDYHASVNLTLIHYAKALRLKGDMSEALRFYDESMK